MNCLPRRRSLTSLSLFIHSCLNSRSNDLLRALASRSFALSTHHIIVYRQTIPSKIQLFSASTTYIQRRRKLGYILSAKRVTRYSTGIANVLTKTRRASPTNQNAVWKKKISPGPENRWTCKHCRNFSFRRTRKGDLTRVLFQAIDIFLWRSLMPL